jgi:hypothetical protein
MINPDHLRAVLLEKEPPAAGELERIARGLEHILRERRELLALAEKHNLQLGAIF